MVRDIDIISYTKGRSQSNEPPLESGYKNFNGVALKNRKSFRPAEAVALQNQSKIKKTGWPPLIEEPLAIEMKIIKKRAFSLKQNLARDIFLGQAFTYPFIVCIFAHSFESLQVTNSGYFQRVYLS